MSIQTLRIWWPLIPEKWMCNIPNVNTNIKEPPYCANIHLKIFRTAINYFGDSVGVPSELRSAYNAFQALPGVNPFTLVTVVTICKTWLWVATELREIRKRSAESYHEIYCSQNVFYLRQTFGFIYLFDNYSCLKNNNTHTCLIIYWENKCALDCTFLKGTA